jgi:hypothetical protein
MDINNVNMAQIKRQFDALKQMHQQGDLSEAEFHSKLKELGVEQRGDHFEYVGKQDTKPPQNQSQSSTQNLGLTPEQEKKLNEYGEKIKSILQKETAKTAKSVGIPMGLEESPSAKTVGKTAPGVVGPSGNLDFLKHYAQGGPGLLGNTTGQ